jgi:division protein 1
VLTKLQKSQHKKTVRAACCIRWATKSGSGEERGKRKEERGKRKEERGKRKEERGKRKERSGNNKGCTA